MRTKTYPEWVYKYLKPGTNIHPINGKYYLYECKSVYDPVKKRTKKITGKCLGRITKDGFIPSGKRKLEETVKRKIEKPIKVKEYGLCSFIDKHLKEYVSALKKHFPEDYLQILAISYSRFAYNSPLKNVEIRYQQSYMEQMFGKCIINDKVASEVLKRIGNEKDKIESYMKEFVSRKDRLVIDMTHIFSYSRQMEINKIGYNSEHKFDPQVNILYLMSQKRKMPVYYKILPGNIREVKAIKNFIKETEIIEGFIIMDKGFYSEKNIKELEESGIKYIIPLRRDNVLINYKEIKENKFETSAKLFEYQKRPIFGKKIEGKDFDMFIYLDKELKHKEEKEYLCGIFSDPEKFSKEEYNKIRHRFGTIVFITNQKKLSVEKAYHIYKTRNDIEQMFDAQKNVLENDISYMHSIETLEGWMFISHIVLQWYYELYKILNDNNLLHKYSIQDMINILLDVKKVNINGVWYNAEVTNKTANLLDKLKIQL